MRRAFYRRDFHTNVPILIEMFALRSSGVPIFTLAQRYTKDRRTIRCQLRKYNIKPIGVELKSDWGKAPRAESKSVNKDAGKYDYLFLELWDNRSLGV